MTKVNQIRQIVTPIAEKYGVNRVSIFGSRAKGNETADSDYDFLISKGSLESLLSYIAFVNELEDAFGAHVDVVTDTSSDQWFVNNISREAVLLYERER